MSEVPPDPPPDARRSRAPVVLAALCAVLVVTLAVTVPIVVQQVRAESERQSAAAANLDDVVVFEGLRNDHTEADVDYPMSPPAGGPHDPVWLDCGVYDAPVRDENAVHDLEHGSVWITYDPGLDGDDVATLAAALPDNGIMSPYDDLPSPVVVTVWGRQLDLSDADDPRLGLFLAGFADGHTAPEPFASCAGGTTEAGGATTTTV
ncbi:MAG: hypothetical protein JWN22_1540 [Nocardioides sp.]|jgi:hypothetical protein|nr:hypothetical protein [Nocardioides sp.]